MAKLYFRYGTVDSAKTALLLMTRHNYISQGKKVLTIAPDVDNREDGFIKSRALDEKIKPDMIIHKDIFSMEEVEKLEEADCILVEETQFLSPNIITLLWVVAKEKGIPVICYGLRTDFRTKLFPASRRLMELADSIEEIKTECKYCRKKAVFNLRVDAEGEPVFEGSSVLVGYGYEPICGLCYLKRLDEVNEGETVILETR